ncbi:MAG: hypothetical protein A2Z99_07540 [Treponema sp. GWB1_62_6]|nr:MAG: hypothetical protein A2Y36_11910 [Treponema sp. GWA1_62_8]OHE68735.1 MAG: hypothetical protein A2001_13780 [Treponema sp. GWC1_61_84]OHE69580.1 MAG: hypothetical protein A2Z99_07540 [Treponema sp. GWB1_62_6]OHE72184.1 MAG: hypothetical protein A2413_12205 [Treponema sp. RIFOXYC1_FULL_61_9]HCM29140.1 hypothetical protein [Treponema sp.]
MKTELFTFCDFAQENGGKLTVVGTFDTIIAREFPCTHPLLSVVIRLRFDIWEFGRHVFHVESRDLDGAALVAPVDGTLEVRGAGNATAVSHVVFNVSGVRFAGPGVINLSLHVDEKEIASIPLYVRKG